jgi:hypothetical protein
VSTTLILSPGDPRLLYSSLSPVAVIEKRESNPKYGPHDVLIVIEVGRSIQRKNPIRMHSSCAESQNAGTIWRAILDETTIEC